MSISIKALASDYCQETFAFEVENKVFFEKTCAPRPHGYFTYESFSEIYTSLLKQIGKDTLLMFLIFEGETLVGRINVSDFEVEQSGVTSAMVGYRIGEKFQGKGIATQALHLVINFLKTKGYCQKLYAGAALENYGSQIVLLKNQFSIIGQVDNSDFSYGPGAVYVEFETTI